MIGRALLLLGAWALSSVAIAQGLSFRPSPQALQVPDWWLVRRSAHVEADWVKGQAYAFAEAYASWLTPEGELLAPFAFYRNDDWSVAAGAQRTAGMGSGLPALTIEGIRYDRAGDFFRVAIAGGESTTFDLPLRLRLGDAMKRYEFGGVLVEREFSRGDVLGLSSSFWDAGSEEASHEIVAAHWRSAHRLGGRLNVSYGRDLAATKRTGRDQESLQWDLSWSSRRGWIAARGDMHGLEYGPDVVENGSRGTDIASMNASWRVSRNLEWGLVYNEFGFDFGLGDEIRSLSNRRLVQTLRATRPSGTVLIAEAGMLMQKSGAETRDGYEARGEAFFKATRGWSLSTRGQVTAIEGDEFWLLSQHAARRLPKGDLDLGLDLRGAGVGGIEPYATARWDQPIPGVTGTLRAAAAFSPGLNAASYASFDVQGRAEPSPRWSTAAAIGWVSSGAFSELSYSGEVGYIIDARRQLTVRLGRNPFMERLAIGTEVLDASTQFSIDFRTSLGGSLNRGLEHRLAPRAAFDVVYRPGGDPAAEWRPLQGAMILLDGGRRLETNERGRAEAIVPTGPLRATLLPPAGAHEIIGVSDLRFDLAAAGRAHGRFEVVLWSSIEAVVFNDQGGEGRTGPGFIPIEGIRLELPGEETRRSGSSGEAVWGRLTPGTYTVSIDPSAVPPGAALTTPASRTIELAPGKTAAVEFGLRAFGTLAGSLTLLDEAATAAPFEPSVDLAINGQKVAIRAGEYRTRVPAGSLTVLLEIPRVLSDLYVVGENPIRINVDSEQDVRLDWVLARYGSIRVEVLIDGRPAGSGIPVIVTNLGFRYTDSAGIVEFTQLRRGEYRVEIPKESLPSGTSLAGPDLIDISLQAGGERTVRVELTTGREP